MQQQQFQNILANQQRLQQQQAVQAAQQQQQQQQAGQITQAQAPTPSAVATPMAQSLTSLTSPSPQAQQSPATTAGMLGASPVATRMQPVPSGGAGPGMQQAGTPVQAGQPAPPGLSVFGSDPTKIIEQLPQLMKMRQSGQMNAEMQKTVSEEVWVGDFWYQCAA